MPKKKKKKKETRAPEGTKGRSKKKSAPKRPEEDSFGFLSDIAGEVMGQDAEDDSDDPFGAALESLGLGDLAKKLGDMEMPPEVAECIQETLEEMGDDPEAFINGIIEATSEDSIEELVEVLTADYEDRSGPEILDGVDMTTFPLTPEEQIAAAKRAIEIRPERLEPYVVWADALDEPEHRATIAQIGLNVGRQLLEETGFPKKVPRGFDMKPIGVSYVRLMTTLALALTDARRLDEAIVCWNEVLPLARFDLDTIRQHMANTLLLAGHDSEALEILAALDEDEFEFDVPYHLVLLRFRVEGDSPAAREALTDAVDYNPDFVEYLLHPERLDDFDPADEYIRGPETPEEARYYAREFGAAWSETPGVLEWLRSRTKGIH